jgi:hypothetical protein
VLERWVRAVHTPLCYIRDGDQLFAIMRLLVVLDTTGFSLNDVLYLMLGLLLYSFWRHAGSSDGGR